MKPVSIFFFVIIQIGNEIYRSKNKGNIMAYVKMKCPLLNKRRENGAKAWKPIVTLQTRIPMRNIMYRLLKIDILDCLENKKEMLWLKMYWGLILMKK